MPPAGTTAALRIVGRPDRLWSGGGHHRAARSQLTPDSESGIQFSQVRQYPLPGRRLGAAWGQWPGVVISDRRLRHVRYSWRRLYHKNGASREFQSGGNGPRPGSSRGLGAGGNDAEAKEACRLGVSEQAAPMSSSDWLISQRWREDHGPKRAVPRPLWNRIRR